MLNVECRKATARMNRMWGSRLGCPGAGGSAQPPPGGSPVGCPTSSTAGTLSLDAGNRAYDRRLVRLLPPDRAPLRRELLGRIPIPAAREAARGLCLLRLLPVGGRHRG